MSDTIAGYTRRRETDAVWGMEVEGVIGNGLLEEDLLSCYLKDQ